MQIMMMMENEVLLYCDSEEMRDTIMESQFHPSYRDDPCSWFTPTTTSRTRKRFSGKGC